MKTLTALSAIATVVAMLLASTAQADPARHPHDYLASQRHARATTAPEDVRDHAEINKLVASQRHARTATNPQDVRDHAEIKQLVATYGNPLAPTTTTPGPALSWADAGTDAGITVGGLLILAATTLAVRRRRQPAL